MKFMYLLKKLIKLSSSGFILLFSTAIFSLSSYGQTTLSAGDIAFTGADETANTVNGVESNKDFCFILLKAITAHTIIYFTDYGWRSDAAAFQTALPCGANTGSVTDGVVKWEAATDMSYGTQVRIRSQYTPSASVGTATGFQAAYNPPTQYVTVASSGESLFAFQGTIGSPTLIAGINLNSSGWATTLSNCDYTPTLSTLPAALNSNNYAFTLTPSSSNMRLKSSVNIPGDAASARTTIATKANWEFSSSAFTLPASNVVLPVTITSFTATLENKIVKLLWQTATEELNKSFIIYRYGDNQSESQIGRIDGAGSSSSLKNYSFSDKNPLPGNNFYRLTQVDQDGTEKLLGTRHVNVISLIKQLSFFPNPTQDKVKLSFVAGSFTQLTIMDLSGHVLKKVSITPSANSLNVDLSPYRSGTYLLKCSGVGANEIIKVEKKASN